MEDLDAMRSDVLTQKAVVEEELSNFSDPDHIKEVVIELSRDILKKLHEIDKSAVKSMKAEAFDELRRLNKCEDSISLLIGQINKIQEPSKELIEMVANVVLCAEELLSLKKEYVLNTCLKESHTNLVSDSIFLRNDELDPRNVKMSLDSSGKFICIKLEPKSVSSHLLNSLSVCVRGVHSKSVKNVSLDSYRSSDNTNIYLRKQEEDLEISVTIFDSNIDNSPMIWKTEEAKQGFDLQVLIY